jgi:PhzF family phenazine biosynthesis protein
MLSQRAASRTDTSARRRAAQDKGSDQIDRPIVVHVDAFTDRPYTGNSAGVVLNADGLAEAEMNLLARELRHSETVFVLKPESHDHDVHLRYFTPLTEVPICGHATIAAHVARAAILGSPLGESTQRTGAGLQRVEISATAGRYRVTLHQGRPKFKAPLGAPLTDQILEAFALRPEELLKKLPVQIVSTGHAKVIVPLAVTAERLDTLAPNLDALSALSSAIDCSGFFAFRMGDNDSYTEGRTFSPAIGIAEDPVTGNANGALGAYLVRHGVLRGSDQVRFEGHQGRALGRPGCVFVRVDHDNRGEPLNVSISGDAVILFAAALDSREGSLRRVGL